MTQNLVEFTVAEPVHSTRAEPLRLTHHYRWLSRLGQWVAVKLKFENAADHAAIKRYVIDKRKVTKYIVEQMRYLEQFWARKPRRVFMGPEALSEILGDASPLNHMVTFPISFEAWQPTTGTQVYGLMVTVVPWMKGAIVMPDDEYTKALDANERQRQRIHELEEQNRRLLRERYADVAFAEDVFDDPSSR